MRLAVITICLLLCICSSAQILTGFKPTGTFNEQELQINNQPKDVSIEINAPLNFSKKGKTFLVFFALPNGNSIEWTKGKKTKEGDDWHFDIQHIAAQTRFIRSLDQKNNYVLVYLITAQKSWPAWKRATADATKQIKQIVDSVTNMFQSYSPHVVLNGHSGGGSFIFGYLDAVESIPSNIDRIAFLDSDYGYETEKHAKKLADWLKQSQKNNLVVLAYNDSVVIYNGKPLVSPTGGTWYRSRLLQKDLSSSFKFSTKIDTAFLHHTALNGRIQIHLKQNPTGLIYHTVQVEKNGFIYSILSNTRFDKQKYFHYFGERVYSQFISTQ
jgi:hypothetical protein